MSNGKIYLGDILVSDPDAGGGSTVEYVTLTFYNMYDYTFYIAMTDNGYVSGYANSSNDGDSIQVVKGSFIMFIHGSSSISQSHYVTTGAELTYAQLTNGTALSTRYVSGVGYMDVVIASDDIRLIVQGGSG